MVKKVDAEKVEPSSDIPMDIAIIKVHMEHIVKKNSPSRSEYNFLRSLVVIVIVGLVSASFASYSSFQKDKAIAKISK